MTNKLKIENYPYIKDINGTHVPKNCEISILITTGTWEEYGTDYDYSVRATLNMEVNDNSGEDGALAPILSFPPLEHAACFTSVNELVGKKIVEEWKDPIKDNYKYFWEGTFGTDIDGCLTANSILFKEYSNQQFCLEWSADITNWAAGGRWGEKIGALRFEGNATFQGLVLRIKNEDDESEIISKVFNTSIDEWNKNWEKSILVDKEIYGPIDPASANLNSRVVNITIEDRDLNWKKTTRQERIVYRNDPLSLKTKLPDTTWYQITYLPK